MKQAGLVIPVMDKKWKLWGIASVNMSFRTH